jgi:hypothetical protein
MSHARSIVHAPLLPWTAAGLIILFGACDGRLDNASAGDPPTALSDAATDRQRDAGANDSANAEVSFALSEEAADFLRQLDTSPSSIADERSISLRDEEAVLAALAVLVLSDQVDGRHHDQVDPVAVGEALRDALVERGTLVAARSEASSVAQNEQALGGAVDCQKDCFNWLTLAPRAATGSDLASQVVALAGDKVIKPTSQAKALWDGIGAIKDSSAAALSAAAAAKDADATAAAWTVIDAAASVVGLVSSRLAPAVTVYSLGKVIIEGAFEAAGNVQACELEKVGYCCGADSLEDVAAQNKICCNGADASTVGDDVTCDTETHYDCDGTSAISFRYRCGTAGECARDATTLRDCQSMTHWIRTTCYASHAEFTSVCSAVSDDAGCSTPDEALTRSTAVKTMNGVCFY